MRFFLGNSFFWLKHRYIKKFTSTTEFNAEKYEWKIVDWETYRRPELEIVENFLLSIYLKDWKSKSVPATSSGPRFVRNIYPTRHQKLTDSGIGRLRVGFLRFNISGETLSGQQIAYCLLPVPIFTWTWGLVTSSLRSRIIYVSLFKLNFWTPSSCKKIQFRTAVLGLGSSTSVDSTVEKTSNYQLTFLEFLWRSKISSRRFFDLASLKAAVTSRI